MEDFETLSEKLARVTSECERLREENSRLRELLNQVAGLSIAGKLDVDFRSRIPLILQVRR